MTRKLYYENGYQARFTAKVINCQIGKKGYEVILDQTAFYPEGGGQPADIGMIEEVRVSDVRLKDDIITHITDGPLEIGREVEGRIDFKRRFDLMQQHSGEHIISGIIHAKYGYSNVGFHLSEAYMTCDFDGELTTEQVQEIETLANEAIYKNLTINCTMYQETEIKDKPYRSKLDLVGDIRLVTVPAYDTCACCGIHVRTTGEIGSIKCIASERHRGGTRMTVLCGNRALMDYQNKHHIVIKASKSLSVKPEMMLKNLAKLQEELQLAKQKVASLTNELFEYKSEGYLQTEAPVIHVYEPDLQADALRRLCLLLIEKTDKMVLVLTGESQNFKYALGAKAKDVRPLNKLLTGEFKGKGGGKAELCQGHLAGNQKEIEAFYKTHYLV